MDEYLTVLDNTVNGCSMTEKYKEGMPLAVPKTNQRL